MPQRILFVEDNLNTSRAMKVMLELKGFAVDTAASVSQAVEQLEVNTYDILISDIGLPDGHGYDILHRSKASLPAIALSGYTSEADRLSCLEKGFTEYLTKPFKMDELLQAIGRVSA